MPTTVSKREIEEFRTLIDSYLGESGESVSALAVRAGVDRSLLSKIRNGTYERSPTLDVMHKIGKCIGKRLIWIDD